MTINFSLLHNVKFINLIKSLTVVILLQITEDQMEAIFACPCNSYRIGFVCMYFIIPAAAFTIFALYLQEGRIFQKTCSPKCCCVKEKFRKNFRRYLQQYFLIPYPAFCWVVILLIDGKYTACGMYMKCNSNMTYVDTKDPEMVQNMMTSKICGFSLIAVFLLLYCIYLCKDCCSLSPEDRYEELYISQVEEKREEFARKHAKMCAENRATLCEEDLRRKAESHKSRTPSGPEGSVQCATEPVYLDAKTTVDIILKYFPFANVCIKDPCKSLDKIPC